MARAVTGSLVSRIPTPGGAGHRRGGLGRTVGCQRCRAAGTSLDRTWLARGGGAGAIGLSTSSSDEADRVPEGAMAGLEARRKFWEGVLIEVVAGR